MSEERRPPRNMQGLLNFCTELTLKEDAPNPPSAAALDPEKQKFLQDVLENMTVNTVKKIATHIKSLADFTDSCQAGIDNDRNEEQVEELEEALEDLLSIIDDIDNANDLVKMGGVPVLIRGLTNGPASIRELCCEVLREISQNNPQCQKEVVDSNGLHILLKLIDSDPVTSVRPKALSAASSVIRSYEPGMKVFDEVNGFSCLMRAMLSHSDKLFIKAAFLITHLIQEYKPATALMLNMGYPELLINYLCGGDSEEEGEEGSTEAGTVTGTSLMREHCSSALLQLCSVSSEARDVCRRTAGLTNTLNTRKESLRGKEEHQEEFEYLSELLKLLDNQSTANTFSSEALR